ncbi:MAG TPA: hypothetical protein VN905_02455, partial [Candidatus Binatia bacterium]|nr:hypothetical protein [Candidatus Binatia bacterium]
MRTLPKTWNVHLVVTQLNDIAPIKHLSVSAKGAHKTFVEPKLKLTVVKQNGPHVHFTYESKRTKEALVGVLSPDGKVLQIVGEHLVWTLYGSGKKMSGPGSYHRHDTKHHGA